MPYHVLVDFLCRDGINILISLILMVQNSSYKPFDTVLLKHIYIVCVLSLYTLLSKPWFINPRRACAARVMVLGLCVCLCVCYLVFFNSVQQSGKIAILTGSELHGRDFSNLGFSLAHVTEESARYS